MDGTVIEFVLPSKLQHRNTAGLGTYVIWEI